MTVIVAGKVYVDPDERDEFVDAHRGIVEKAREQPGCLDLSISPDPGEPGRVNVFEHRESAAALDAWRALAEPPATSVRLRDEQMFKHQVSESGPPFD